MFIIGQNDDIFVSVSEYTQGPLLLTWINFNSSIEK